MCVQFSGHFPLLFVGPEIHWRIFKQKIETAVLRIFNFGHFREIHLLFSQSLLELETSHFFCGISLYWLLLWRTGLNERCIDNFWNAIIFCTKPTTSKQNWTLPLKGISWNSVSRIKGKYKMSVQYKGRLHRCSLGLFTKSELVPLKPSLSESTAKTNWSLRHSSALHLGIALWLPVRDRAMVTSSLSEWKCTGRNNAYN